MRKVIGIGETILDIVFRNEQPSAAVPGGSVFNGLVSLARAGVSVEFISEVGDDRVGNIICRFLEENNISTQHINRQPDSKSPISLAFLNENNDAEYQFYKYYDNQQLCFELPEINEDDIVIFGSFYALNPVLRDKVLGLLERAKANHAIIYYDPNFRASHQQEALKLMPTIIENLEFADIVRGSNEDFNFMFGLKDIEKVYNDKIKFYCNNFLCTQGGEKVILKTKGLDKAYPTLPIETVSTIGAGDNFNAGILFGLIHENVRHCQLETLPEATWDKIVDYAIRFSSEVCQSYQNYVSNEFAQSLK